MANKGMKDIDKTALGLSLALTALVGVVAWRSHGEPMAICFTAGLPLGAFAFWLVFTLGKMIEEKDNARKNFQKMMNSGPQANPLQSRMVYAPATPEVAAAALAPITPVAPAAIERMIAEVAAAIPVVATAEIDVEPSFMPFNLANLNELDYLYKPSSMGRERGTLFLASETTKSTQTRPGSETQDVDLELEWREAA